jgi:hypothetical protein
MVDLPNERTLLGAIENFMSSVVHVRPYLAQGYREVLEDMAEAWLDAGGANTFSSVAQSWLDGFVQQASRPETRTARRAALDDFLGWMANAERASA